MARYEKKAFGAATITCHKRPANGYLAISDTARAASFAVPGKEYFLIPASPKFQWTNRSHEDQLDEAGLGLCIEPWAPRN